ncbi:Smr/MutS family protein [uncultured Treponema sp.]|uniref:endonuclease MutS2 n=1 Tax=uncultured Treponema sp. TaxID=162155 RepID=UPI0025DDA4BB|nr:Smr/MutS family protein [uncultured Treponema sp.]
MHKKTLEQLDYYRLRQTIAGYCVSMEGKRSILSREPYTQEQIEKINQLKTLSSQWQRAITSKNPLHLSSWNEIASFIKLLQADGTTLEQEQLYSLYLFASSASSLYASVKTAASSLSLKNLLDLAETLPYSAIEQTLSIISRIIDKDGNLKDLPSLREIRAKIAQIQSEIKSALKKYTSDTSLNTVLESNVPAFRADRQVLAVKASQRNRISGIVHEVSASGQTLFIEPEEVVRKNNELLQEESRLAQETRRIFRETTALLHPLYDDLKSALKTMTLFDETYAAARWGAENLCNYAMECKRTEEDAPLLIQARHPLLGENAVPIDIKWLPGKNILIITGPNTGGKTVTLKTFALFSMLNQSGFPIPASDSTRLPIFNSIFADIGDDQSIDNSLSTFSAHMKNIAAAVRHADSHSLVLLDEFGGGTDPQEGGAVAMACLDSLIEKQAFVLVTTHHGSLKNYGYTTPSCINASAEFDSQSLAPTYKIVMGVPGESHALDIAKRSGLPGSVVAKAKSYLTNQQADVSTLIRGLTKKHAELDRREKEFADKENRQNEKILKLEQKDLKLRQKENELKERESRNESRFLRETRKTLENLVRELREGEITREKTLKMRKFLNDLTEDVELQELELEEEKERLEKEQEELQKRLESEEIISENGMRISKSSDSRTQSSKKTKRKLSNKEALKTAKATYTDEEVFNLTPRAKNQPAPKFEFAEGAEVLVGSSRSKGILLREEKKGVWLVQLGSIRMSVKQKEMQLISPTKLSTADYTVELNKDEGSGSPVFELRLLGMREEEAIRALQKQLDLCAMTSFKSFSVIHGKGNGILQQAVQDYLSNYPGVKSFYYARPEDGGFGKTYVEMN